MRFAGLAVLTALLAGCTTYSDMGFTGGVESQWIADDMLSISASGNAFASDRRIGDFTRLKAAEEAIDAGFRFFSIVGQEDTSVTEAMYVPQRSTTTTTGTVYGNSFNATSYTNTSGGYYSPVYKPGEAIVVQMSRESLGRHSYNAEEILNDLGPRYMKGDRLAELQAMAAALPRGKLKTSDAD